MPPFFLLVLETLLCLLVLGYGDMGSVSHLVRGFFFTLMYAPDMFGFFAGMAFFFVWVLSFLPFMGF